MHAIFSFITYNTFIHAISFTDLKPSNIIVDLRKQSNLVYIIDFELSKEFRNFSTCTHIPYNEGLGFIGTTTFTSINSHLSLELGRCDDLESLAYVMLYFLWGFLPWQNLGCDGQAILESK